MPHYNEEPLVVMADEVLSIKLLHRKNQEQSEVT